MSELMKALDINVNNVTRIQMDVAVNSTVTIRVDHILTGDPAERFINMMKSYELMERTNLNK